MKKISILPAALSFAAVIALIPAIAQATIWKNYTNAALGFSVDFADGAASRPHNPARRVDQTQQTAYGPVTSSQLMFAARSGRSDVTVETFTAAARSVDPNVMAEGVIAQIIHHEEGQAPQLSSFAVPGGAGREAIFVSHSSFGLGVAPLLGHVGDRSRVRVYYRWPHLYVVEADADESTGHVFESFRLLDQGGAPARMNLARE